MIISLSRVQNHSLVRWKESVSIEKAVNWSDAYWEWRASKWWRDIEIQELCKKGNFAAPRCIWNLQKPQKEMCKRCHGWQFRNRRQARLCATEAFIFCRRRHQNAPWHIVRTPRCVNRANSYRVRERLATFAGFPTFRPITFHLLASYSLIAASKAALCSS